jgi:hypothetical protein
MKRERGRRTNEWMEEGRNKECSPHFHVHKVHHRWHNEGGPMLKGREEKGIRFGAKLEELTPMGRGG